MKKNLLTIFCVIATIFGFAGFVLAVSSGLSWSQTDWSSDYSDTSSVSTSTGEITLATSSNWYDASWKYRQSITVTNNSGATLTNYQIPVYLNTSQLITDSKMKNDCEDIRIIDSSGNVLPIWIASAPTANTCNQTNTKIWTKLSSLPTAGDTLYLYYGNSSASAVSNGNNVFITFADFTTGSSLPTGWTKTDIGTSGTASVGSGVLTISNTNGEDVWTNIYGGTHVYSTTTITGSFVAEALVNSQTNSDPWAKTGITSQNNLSAVVENGQSFIIITPENGIAFQYQSSSGDPCVGGCIAPNVQTNSGSYSFPLFLKLTKNTSNQTSGYYSSNGTSWTQRGSTITPAGISDTQYVTLFATPHNTSATGEATYSFFYTRSYTASEPSVGTPQTEENRYTTSGVLASSIFDAGAPADFGIATYSYLSATNTTVTVKIRTDDNSDMSEATDFSSCDPITSNTDISSNNCVTDHQRYAQYQVSFTSSDGLYSPTFQSINIAYSLTPTYTLSYTADTGGSITGSSTQIVYDGNNGSEVTAVPNSGYSFSKWSDDSTENPRTDLNITGDLSFTANFIANNHNFNHTVASKPKIELTPYLENNQINFTVTNVIQMAISKDKNFSDASWIEYKSPIKTEPGIWYIKFRSSDGGETNPFKISQPEILKTESLIVEKTKEEIAENITKIQETTFLFEKNLRQGMKHQDVKELQKYLNNQGFLVDSSGVGAPGNESNYFGSLTKSALIKFQKANGISPALGYFGPITRQFINSL